MHGWHNIRFKVNVYQNSVQNEQHSGPPFKMKMAFYQCRNSHYGDKTIWRPSYLHNGISYTGKTSLCWIRALAWTCCEKRSIAHTQVWPTPRDWSFNTQVVAWKICCWSQWLLSLQWRHKGRTSVSNHPPHVCLLSRLNRRRSKKISKLRVNGLCAGNSLGTGEFPAQMASKAENVSIWWRHHVVGVDKPFPSSVISWVFFHNCQGTSSCQVHTWRCATATRLWWSPIKPESDSGNIAGIFA